MYTKHPSVITDTIFGCMLIHFSFKKRVTQTSEEHFTLNSRSTPVSVWEKSGHISQLLLYKNSHLVLPVIIHGCVLPSLSLEDADGSWYPFPHSLLLCHKLPQILAARSSHLFAQLGKETRKAFYTPQRHGEVATRAGRVPHRAGKSLACYLGYWQMLPRNPAASLGITLQGWWDRSPVEYTLSVTVLWRSTQCLCISRTTNVVSLLKLETLQQHATLCFPRQGSGPHALERRVIDTHSLSEGGRVP